MVTAAPSPMAVRPRIAVVIPTLNEAGSIGAVIRAMPRDWVDRVIVVDGRSTDATAAEAHAAGAEVVVETRPGYGRACQTGAERGASDCPILVFLDGDGSDRPDLIPGLVAPLIRDGQDFVIGSRARGEREAGSMGAHQLLAGWLVGLALWWLYGVRYTDMCAFRAIRAEALAGLGMRQMSYGWNLEMQMLAARAGLRILELPVAHRRRSAGASKVSGSLRGTIRAGARIIATLWTVAREPAPNR
ncbi:MAG TPA: glycosyltransferase family 2 protein [Stellaceae bacterium]|nr:glycosyltransferase family 2 protein [Stellaceae bacterium]